MGSFGCPFCFAASSKLQSTMNSARRQPQLAILLLALVPLAWLVPNHFNPWPAAWQDGPALALTLLATLLLPQRGDPRVTRAWWLAALLVAVSVVSQCFSGRIVFTGDGWMVLLYVGAFMCALATGSAVVQQRAEHVEWLALGLVVAACASVGLALAQWLRIELPALWMSHLPPGARPFGNLAQPNQLGSAVFLGLCALALLRERAVVSRPAWWLGSVWLIWGMVMTGSRTGWLQAGLLLMAVVILGRRCRLTVTTREVTLLLIIFALATWIWPSLNQALQLEGGRAVSDQIATGTGRIPLWRALIHAVTLEPWRGYGWQQVVHAQLAAALDQPAVGRHFEHAHNIVLDLVLWVGLPLGLVITGLAAAAVAVIGVATRDARVVWLWVAVLGLVVHALLEFPLEYAYLLLPCGALLGAATALAHLEGRSPRLLGLGVADAQPVLGWRLGAVALLALLLVVGRDYALVEPNHRLLRMETARIGTDRIVSKAPQLWVLDQQEAFLQFARTPARTGMTSAEFEQMRRVARRFAYPPAMLRHALAAGLNGHPDEAARVLRRLCSVHPVPRCEEARAAWPLLQAQHPELAGIPAP
jgi:O-antigen ligase